MENNINEAVLAASRENGGIPQKYSALTLAYLGDAVYEIYVRSHLTEDGNHKVNDLHKTATRYVCAKAQAEFYHKIEHVLTDDEKSAFKRGRNAKSHPPKNADMIDYKIATGVETMLGHLYIEGKCDRISELMGYLFA